MATAIDRVAVRQAARAARWAERQWAGIPAPAGWREWLTTLFPVHVKAGFAAHHAEMWEWVWSIELESVPRPFVAIWARGGGKSTGAELGTTALGLRGRRRYALYVRQTQELADKSVANIGALLESRAVERHYPQHADRLVSKFGKSKGWRRNRLRTAGGFTVDALGLDTAARGVKVEDQRPDLIVLDDIDDKHDSPKITLRKIETITHSILPAGSMNVAVLAIQNLIIPDGVFTRLVDGRADYLADRIVSGPHPAVRGLETEQETDPETGTRRYRIVAGTATWAGQSIEECEAELNRIGLEAFLKECQHEVQEKREGLVLQVTNDALEDLTDEEARRIVRMGQAFGGIDFGDWRFGFVLRAADSGGVLHQIAEFFSQRQDLSYRAKILHMLCRAYGCPDKLPIWGDSANPTDIRELNARLRELKSPYRVMPVGREGKLRAASVARFRDLLARGAIKYRRGVMQHVAEVLRPVLGDEADELRFWRLGQSASSAGIVTIGSRLLWEVRHWSYPAPEPGEAQAQDPDDHTADGADLIAADRYAVMSHWRAGQEPEEKPETPRSRDVAGDEYFERERKRHEREQRRQEREAKRIMRDLERQQKRLTRKYRP